MQRGKSEALNCVSRKSPSVGLRKLSEQNLFLYYLPKRKYKMQVYELGNRANGSQAENHLGEV